MKIRRIAMIALSLILVTAFAAGCSAKKTATLRVGASPSPHAELLAKVKDTLAKEGITLEIVEFTDYVQPNVALVDKTLDANFFQHQPYLDDYNTKNNTHLVSVGSIHYEPMGIYAGKTHSLAEVPNGAIIAVPNDSTNEARALLLLEAQGLIKIKAGAGIAATKNDIVDNPKNIAIKELAAAQLVRSLADVDFAVVNGNFALQGGLKVKDAWLRKRPTPCQPRPMPTLWPFAAGMKTGMISKSSSPRFKAKRSRST